MMGMGFMELVIIAIVLLAVVVGAIGVVVAIVVSGKRRAPQSPNLTPCPDCGRGVSLRAQSCPQCGCPLKG